jgi:seryl-tRNA synthetase
MIDLNKLIEDPELFRLELKRRNRKIEIVDKIIAKSTSYKEQLHALERLRSEKNKFNDIIKSLSESEKSRKLEDMKKLSEEIKELDSKFSVVKKELDDLIKGIPNILWEWVPQWKDDSQNPVVEIFWIEKKLNFQPKPYWELEVYKKYVKSEEGANAMWSRWFYMKWEIARFQKVLFDYAQDIILQSWYELFYVPIMLNDKVLTWTWHLPDFDWQQYEVKIDENKNFYLIGSSEPSIMGYFMNKNIWDLKTPILATCWSSCFRKEAWSYGKDQQWILRVHQFEKVEMVVICRPEHNNDCFEKNWKINERIWNSLWIHFRKVEVCSGDMPWKHYRQQDYEGWFPWVQKFRELWSNGNASDYQNRWLNISYTDDNWKKMIPWWLNDTWITFRTWLAILEQYQTEDWRVKIPDVLIERFGKEHIE